MKTCIYCGETKDEEQFREYYNRKTGRYRYCRSCERIEMRRKYLCRKTNRTDEDNKELVAINRLYDVRREAGLQAPGQSRIKPRISVLSQVLEETSRLESK